MGLNPGLLPEFCILLFQIIEGISVPHYPGKRGGSHAFNLPTLQQLTPCLPSPSSHMERHWGTQSSAPWNCSSTYCNSSLSNPYQQNLQNSQANSSFPHSCQQPGIPHCSGQLCSMKEKSNTTSVPRKGDVVLEHICSAPKLLLSYSGVQAWARSASVFWDITSLYQSKAALMSSQKCEDRGVPCMSSALPHTNKRNSPGPYLQGMKREKTHSI